MTDAFGPARRRDARDVAERAAIREGQHAVLADLLGAYADGELPAESAARVEAHLVGCTRCRRDLDAQIALRDRLAAEVVLPSPPALRDRILAATAAIPAPVLPPPAADVAAPSAAPGATPVVWRRWWVAALVLVVLLAGGIAGGVAVRGRALGGTAPVAVTLAEPVSRVPLLAAAVADYRRATAGDLPGRARDLDAVRAAVGFAVEPLRGAGFRLLGAWTTTLDGEAAAVLAYRHGDALVLQYLVPDAQFFRHSALRAAAAAHRPLAAADGAQALVAWPEPTSGALVVSEGTPRWLAGILPPLVLDGSSSSRGPDPEQRPVHGS